MWCAGIAAECAYVDERGGVGICLKPAVAIVREYSVQFRASAAPKAGTAICTAGAEDAKTSLKRIGQGDNGKSGETRKHAAEKRCDPPSESSYAVAAGTRDDTTERGRALAKAEHRGEREKASPLHSYYLSE